MAVAKNKRSPRGTKLNRIAHDGTVIVEPAGQTSLVWNFKGGVMATFIPGPDATLGLYSSTGDEFIQLNISEAKHLRRILNGIPALQEGEGETP